jgi:hypothetical protein
MSIKNLKTGLKRQITKLSTDENINIDKSFITQNNSIKNKLGIGIGVVSSSQNKNLYSFEKTFLNNQNSRNRDSSFNKSESNIITNSPLRVRKDLGPGVGAGLTRGRNIVSRSNLRSNPNLILNSSSISNLNRSFNSPLQCIKQNDIFYSRLNNTKPVSRDISRENFSLLQPQINPLHSRSLNRYEHKESFSFILKENLKKNPTKNGTEQFIISRDSEILIPKEEKSPSSTQDEYKILKNEYKINVNSISTNLDATSTSTSFLQKLNTGFRSILSKQNSKHLSIGEKTRTLSSSKIVTTECSEKSDINNNTNNNNSDNLYSFNFVNVEEHHFMYFKLRNNEKPKTDEINENNDEKTIIYFDELDLD